MSLRRIIRAFPVLCAAVLAGLTCTKDPASPDDLRDELTPKGTINGYVYDKWGNPIKDVVVSIDSDSATPGVTNAEGAFTVGRVLPGTYTLRFTRWDFEDDSTYEVAVGLAEDLEMIDTVRLSWAYYILAGRVVYNGTPVPGAGVCAPEGDVSELTDENGEFCLSEVPKSPNVKLICAKTGFGFNVVANVKGKDDDTLVLPDIDLREHEGASVSGTVYDSLGNPVKNVVVAAVGGGLADTTNVYGEYVLRNFPGNEQLRIYVPGQKEQFGAVSGFSVGDSSFVSDIDIYMRPKGDYRNGMALSVADLHVVDTLATARLSVYPSVNDVKITIAGYTWTLTGDDTLTVTTTEPWLAMAMDSLQALLAGEGYEITVEVSATNGEGASSLTETFHLFVHGTSPTVVAGGATSTGGTLGDTVKVTSGDFVYLSGSATDYFGGLDTVSWDFGDGSAPWVSTDSLIEVEHRYKKAGTHHAEFRAVDVEGNEVRDTVVVVVSAGAVGVPVYVGPADGDTATADTVRFVWHPVTGDGVMYRLCLDADNRPPRTIVADSLTDTSYAAAVDSGTVYQWYVEAFDASNSASGDTLSLSGRIGGAGDTATAPVFSSTPSSMDQTGIVDTPYVDTVHATDPDSDALRFSLLEGPASMILTDSIVSWTPGAGDTGLTAVSLVVSDGKGGSDTIAWNIAVSPSGSAPTAIIQFGVPVTDSIVPAVDVDKYSFIGESGDRITVRMDPVDPGFDATVKLVSPDGGILIAESSLSGGTNFIDTVALPESGTYAVLVSSRYGNKTSPYTLGVYSWNHQLSSSPSIQYDVPVADTIDPGVDMDAWTFQGESGDRITVRMDPVDPGFDATVKLVSPDGGILIAESSLAGGTNFIDTVALPESGTYAVLVSSRYGNKTSPYTLGVYSWNHQLSSSPSIQYDVPVADTIDPGVDIDAWTFQGAAGDIVSIRMAPTSVGFGSEIVLMSPEGNAVTSQTSMSGSSNLLDDIPLTGSGTYVILIMSRYGNDTSEYTLSLSRR